MKKRVRYIAGIIQVIYSPTNTHPLLMDSALLIIVMLAHGRSIIHNNDNNGSGTSFSIVVVAIMCTVL